jgi:hypothetical protein
VGFFGLERQTKAIPPLQLGEIELRERLVRRRGGEREVSVHHDGAGAARENGAEESGMMNRQVKLD